MGKRIIQQRRGRGTHTYKVRKKAFTVKPKYPVKLEKNTEFEKLGTEFNKHQNQINEIKITKSQKKIFNILNKELSRINRLTNNTLSIFKKDKLINNTIDKDNNEEYF